MCLSDESEHRLLTCEHIDHCLSSAIELSDAQFLADVPSAEHALAHVVLVPATGDISKECQSFV